MNIKSNNNCTAAEAIEIGLRIKERRKELGITLSQLADSLGFNKSTMQRYETGQVRKIKLPVLQAIAKALRVDPQWLALKTDIKSETVSPIFFIGTDFTANDLSSAEHQLITVYHSLNSEGQDKLIEYADDLISSNKYKKDTPIPSQKDIG